MARNKQVILPSLLTKNVVRSWNIFQRWSLTYWKLFRLLIDLNSPTALNMLISSSTGFPSSRDRSWGTCVSRRWDTGWRRKGDVKKTVVNAVCGLWARKRAREVKTSFFVLFGTVLTSHATLLRGSVLNSSNRVYSLLPYHAFLILIICS